MKKYLYFPLVILSMFLALTGCSQDNSDDPQPTPVPEPVTKGLTPLASADSWFNDAKSLQDQGYDPQMMVVIFSLENLPVECSTDDIAAAFVGDQCRYAATIQKYNDKLYGGIMIYRIDSDGSQPLSFSIRYYSKKEKGYFTSAPITFETDETMGTLTEPIHLTWMN